MPSNLDYKSLTDISRPHDLLPSKARRQPPFSGSTVYYRSLLDRANRHPDFEGMSDDEISDIENNACFASYTLNGYYGYAVLIEVIGDEPVVESQQIIEAYKKFRETTVGSETAESRLQSAPSAPPCIMLRRNGKDGETYLSIDSVMYLRSIGVQLVAVESSAIASAEDYESISGLMSEGDLSWLVRVDLSNVSTGVPYMLCAFPIEHSATGAVPCRAVLIGFGE